MSLKRHPILLTFAFAGLWWLLSDGHPELVDGRRTGGAGRQLGGTPAGDR